MLLHPSYSELIKVVNGDVEEGETPVVNSRYSIVMATAKRARQVIARQSKVKDEMKEYKVSKPLSKAVDELYTGQLKILPEEKETETVTEAEAEVETLAEAEPGEEIFSGEEAAPGEEAASEAAPEEEPVTDGGEDS